MIRGKIKKRKSGPMTKLLSVFNIMTFAQSAGAVEYTDCTSAEG